jgi:hypothetical protein
VNKETRNERKFIELHQAIQNNGGVECETIPEYFFPEERDPVTRKMVIEFAKATCSRCPVRMMCLDYALSAGMVGIWGGTTPEERSRIRQGQKGHS